MKLNTYILYLFFSLYSSFILGQTKPNKKEKDFTNPNLNFSCGVILQSRVWGEIGINYGTIHQFIHGPFGKTLLGRLSAEFTFIDNKLLIAPKVGVEKSIGLLDIRASVVRYSKYDISDFRINPEIVIDTQTSSFAFGFSIPLSDTKLNFIPTTKFSVLLNF